MRHDYFTNEMKLKILSPIDSSGTTTNHYHRIQCKLCPNIFVATPKSKKHNFKKWGSPGCPKCTRIVKDKVAKERVVSTLIEMGYELLEPYDNNKIKMLLRNTKCCNRKFRARANNILTGQTICPPCNDEAKAKKMRQFNIDRHGDSLQYKSRLDQYTQRVRVLTEGTYRKHSATINPDNFPRLRAGQEGGYHLDHIESISACFHAGISPKDCAHRSNLQMLPYADNISKGGSNRK